MRRLILLVLPALALTACGGGGDQKTTISVTTPAASTSTSTSTEAAEPSASDSAPRIRDAVQAYSDAFLTGEGAKAYGLLSTRCQERTSQSDFEATVSQAGEQYGNALSFASFSADVSGTMARVTYTYADYPEIDQDSEPWVLEDGAWHEDDC
ncbi:MAG: hypothetical protein QM638_01180 [Nocardioides sp.]|uniref:hypothetical protein n=1 Tax=Nocardioides sp. TaxID=35761 RepID=UPI0039E382E1